LVKKFLYRIFCGFFLGLSVFAPGFSGSIVAIIMGVYQDILRIVSNPFKQFKENVRFCFPLGIGVAVSAVLFVLALNYLFDAYIKATYLLFVGLISGNLPVIVSAIKKCGFKRHYLIAGAAAFAAALALGVISGGGAPASESRELAGNWLILALGGLAGGATTLIPGMSVSIVLLVMGVYSQLIFAAETLLHLDFTYLVPFAFFCVFALAGLVSSSRVIKFVFKKYPGFSNTMVFGFMSGSLLGLLIRSLRTVDPSFNWLLGGAMLAAGLGLSMLFVVLGKKMNAD